MHYQIIKAVKCLGEVFCVRNWEATEEVSGGQVCELHLYLQPLPISLPTPTDGIIYLQENKLRALTDSVLQGVV